MKKTLLMAAVAAFGFAGMASAAATDSPSERLKDVAGSEGYQIAQSCGSGLSVCAPGSYGPGGCYKPGYATCTAGLVCTGGMVACAPSNGAQPYCYKQGYGSCN